MSDHITQARSRLERLCQPNISRSTGSPGNRDAAAWCAEQLDHLGWRVVCPRFDCIDWHSEGAELTVSANTYTVFSSPYTLGCDVNAPLLAISSLPELEANRTMGALVLLYGDLTREQLMPRNFPFYNPEEHQAIYRAMDAIKPAAVITATERNSELVGAQYPFPMIEDGDFDTPSVFMTAEEGQRLILHHGEMGHLQIRADRVSATGCNVIARLGDPSEKRIVFTAHLDAHIGSPGATDDASGVVALLLLAELLTGLEGAPGVEIALLNGEDYYASSGEKLWLAENTGRFGEISLGINLDDVAYINGRTAFSFYNCPENMTDSIRSELASSTALVEGEPWYQGDHMIMVQQGCPALAFTSECMSELMATITHSLRDTPDQVDITKLVNLSKMLCDLVTHIAER